MPSIYKGCHFLIWPRTEANYCRTHNVSVCLYKAYIACGSASLYIKMLYFFLTVLALSAAASVANIKIRYDAKIPQFAIFGTHVIYVFYSRALPCVNIWGKEMLSFARSITSRWPIATGHFPTFRARSLAADGLTIITRQRTAVLHAATTGGELPVIPQHDDHLTTMQLVSAAGSLTHSSLVLGQDIVFFSIYFT